MRDALPLPKFGRSAKPNFYLSHNIICCTFEYSLCRSGTIVHKSHHDLLTRHSPRLVSIVYNPYNVCIALHCHIIVSHTHTHTHTRCAHSDTLSVTCWGNVRKIQFAIRTRCTSSNANTNVKIISCWTCMPGRA